MNFIDLTTETKEQLFKDLLPDIMSMGGKNFFLQMIEDIKKEKENPLLSKNATYRYTKGSIKWRKSIYEETLTALLNAMFKEDKDGDILEGLKPKGYKATMNMMRTLKPVSFKVIPKDIEGAEGFSFSILDTTQMKKTKFSWMFKIIFFYDIKFAKDLLSYRE
jgi:hypothetical protein